MSAQEDLLAAIQSHGSDARDIRDATHEATHAVQSRVRGVWDRERIHSALERLARREASKRMFVAQMVRYELQARAVEMLACEHFGVEYDASKWAMWCAMETVKTYRASIGSIEDIVEAIVICSKHKTTKALFDAVMATKPMKPRVAKERHV